eukprot:TRINITY_DN2961_c0_g1_i1.p1 TRINITY_DN2961_c0_g1~~TRINITY_DN2961_c0_g1_i1.p1  ORF type:complete len:309 (-),score=86.11 TRINITY_DN2961_c0_g1_i1:44-970(-)
MANNNTHFTLDNGTSIPALGFGTWSAEEGDRASVGSLVKEAIKVGYRHIDCAAVYTNEKEIGIAIKEAIEEGLVKREDLYVTSKLWNDAHLSSSVRPAFLQSLQDLQLDYLDLYLIHWPISNQRGEKYPTKGTPIIFVPVSETWAELEKLVDEGLIKSIGISNFNIQGVHNILSYARIKPQVNQVELHPLLTQEDLVSFCRQQGILISGYCPLGGQGSAGKSVLELDLVSSIGKKYNKTPAQVLLRWSIQLGISPLPKSAKKERMESNFNVFDFQLTEEEVKSISSLNKNQRNNDPAKWGAGWCAIFG